ncbi:MAG: patatin-like phospholipase family protein [Proteobacteria bacterium]|nr:patatin-like phospholipase family protein [Pseudomonadota bacterium]MBI3499488.1 patatin-like phospholipase family protein [Pseudomonadota bacterium]
MAMQRPLIGLALGSGVARGWAHLGVLRGLGRLGIKPDIVCGTSIGALVGGSHLSGRIDQLEVWARSLTKFRMVSYLDFKLGGGGMIGGARLLKEMEDHLGGLDIADLPQPFAAIATDLSTGHEVWLREGPLVDAMRASFSMPGVFPPVRLGDRWLIDGALVNPVPVSVCRAMGAQMTIAVNLHADLIGKLRRPGRTYPTVAGFDLLAELEETRPDDTGWRADNFLTRMFGRDPDAPSMFGVMVSALNIVQDRLARSRLAGEPPDVTITPRVGHIGLLEFHRADEVIAEGESAVDRAVADIRDALAIFGHNSR